MTPFLDDGDVTVHHGDCIEVMRTLPAESVDAIVTDPPYGLEFMGKGWDGADGFRRSLNAADVGRDDVFGRASARGPEYRAGTLFQAWCEAWAVEAIRVLKPGGHLAAFGGTRTAHRLAAGIEDAGFEIRDTLAWLYGSGFPKSLDVSKAIDKAAGAEREVTGERHYASGTRPARTQGVPMAPGNVYRWGDEHFGWEDLPDQGRAYFVEAREAATKHTAPATPDAEAWQGWGTALKPAHEPVTLARKPLTGTVAANVLQHGTGALNINACRIDANAHEFGSGGGSKIGSGNNANQHPTSYGLGGRVAPMNPAGRWPANVILDEHAAALLDQQTGELTNCGGPKTTTHRDGMFNTGQPGVIYADRGGASRFFKTVKEDECNASTAGPSSSPPNESADSAPGDAATLEHLGEPRSDLARSGGAASTSEPSAPTPSPSRAPGAENQERTDTTPTTPSPISSSGSATDATPSSTAGADAENAGALTGTRFFYTSKASGAERNDGLHDLPALQRKPYAGGMDGISDPRMERPQERRPAANTHPTVKPVDLMRWLIRLLAPPGATILDPFAGSGTTGVAARLEQIRCILIEREAEYLPIITGRLSQQTLFGGDA